jgi:hypothetical protein
VSMVNAFFLTQGPGAKELKKDLRRLVKSLLKEDRNNLELIVKFAQLEYELGKWVRKQSPLPYTVIMGLLDTGTLKYTSSDAVQRN